MFLIRRLRIHSACTRFFMVRQLTITRSVSILLALCVGSLLYLSYYVSSMNRPTRDLPQPTISCNKDTTMFSHSRINNHSTSAKHRLISKVLFIVENPYTQMGREIIAILEANRIRYKTEMAGKSLPYLTHADKGKFGVVVFETLESYLTMDKWNRQLLDKYCREYSVGTVAFARPDQQLVNAQVQDFPLYVHANLKMRDYFLNPESPILRITRAGEIAHGTLPGDDWTVFVGNHSTYKPLAYAKIRSESTESQSNVDNTDIDYVTAIQDQGMFDGIQRVIFGNGFKFWLHRLLFLDALSCLSHGKFSLPLERYLLIDIDDIFVGKKGTRMKADDVLALVDSQKRLRSYIPGFFFNLGFSGKYFHHGSKEEDKGDDMLIKHRAKFWWFGHSWSHAQGHSLNTSLLHEDMRLNKDFSKKHGLNVNLSYAVAPHHSGVYPVHEELYEAWKRVWGVQVTSTEEYPHLRHARHRRGFTHRGIQVLPRQTCGLFTHTLFIEKYPGGRGKLEHSIRGGELFLTILFNPVSIFMTHMSNYGNDRLALYTFESVAKFIKCWTNLRLQTVPPLQLANIYFSMFPDEKQPVWGNPCTDKRHQAIWSPKKTCEQLPNFLVLGPQKTGTTALYTFLSMHPYIVSNSKSPDTFEEVQFFNGKNYFRGIDWYMNFFPIPSNSSRTVLFEKSANYFDSELAPERARALLPEARLVTLLTHPASRAYSWYQHQKAHDDEVAIQSNFYNVLTAEDDSPRSLRELRNRCLNPGLYAHHLESWLDYYQSKQILILDGEQLKTDPAAVMDKVQSFLNIPRIDYRKLLKYDPKKGFYCQVNGGHTQCLGRSKGRVYPTMDLASQDYLTAFYRKPNVALSKLLIKLGQPAPAWLEDELLEQS